MSAISRRSAAFTLVELLVVIGVIVLLAALAFPAVRSAVSSAKSAEAVSNLKQIGAMIGNYAADNGNRLPYYRKPPNGSWFHQQLALHAGLWKQGQVPGLPKVFFDPCLDGNRLPQHPWGAFGVNRAIIPNANAANQGPLLATIASPSQKVILASAKGDASYSSSWTLEGRRYAEQGPSDLRDAPDPRNSGRAASLFVDGHVENLDVKNMDETARRRHFLP
jgi:general secretion pathway protein G